MLKIYILAVTALIITRPGICAEGTAGGQFLRIGVGAKASALGETGSVASGAQSMFYNPAGLSGVKGLEFSFSQVKWIMDMNYSNLAVAKKSGAGVYGLAVNYLSAPSISKYNKYGNALEDSYSARDMAVMLGYGRQATQRLSWGADIKYISSRLEAASARAAAVDAGVRYEAIPGTFDAGFAVQNLGTRLKYLGESDPLPLNAKLGGQYLIRTGDEMSLTSAQNIYVLSDLNYTQGSGFYASFGLELVAGYSAETLFAVRGGWKTNVAGNAGGFSAGFGMDMKKYVLDYAYSPMGDLGKAHRITFTLRLGRLMSIAPDAALP